MQIVGEEQRSIANQEYPEWDTENIRPIAGGVGHGVW